MLEQQLEIRAAKKFRVKPGETTKPSYSRLAENITKSQSEKPVRFFKVEKGTMYERATAFSRLLKQR